MIVDTLGGGGKKSWETMSSMINETISSSIKLDQQNVTIVSIDKVDL